MKIELPIDTEIEQLADELDLEKEDICSLVQVNKALIIDILKQQLFSILEEWANEDQLSYRDLDLSASQEALGQS